MLSLVTLPSIVNVSSGLIVHLIIYLIHFNSLVKLQTVHLKSLFQRQRMDSLKLLKMMSLSYLLMFKRESHSPTFLCWT